MQTFSFVALSCSLTMVVGQCVFDASGNPPLDGTCLGPLDRLNAFREHRTATSSCPISQIEYVHDRTGPLSDSAASLTIQCGDCVPGTSYIDDGVCSINQFCDDNARCTDVAQHPFMGDACNVDYSGHTATGWCGAGLTCDLASRQCVACVEGALHAARSLYCEEGRWVALATAAAEAVRSASEGGSMNCSDELTSIRQRVDGLHQMAMVAAIGAVAAAILSGAGLIVVIVFICKLDFKQMKRRNGTVAAAPHRIPMMQMNLSAIQEAAAESTGEPLPPRVPPARIPG